MSHFEALLRSAARFRRYGHESLVREPELVGPFA